jgi:hypothetical protein
MATPALPFFVFDRKKHFLCLYETEWSQQIAFRSTIASKWDSRCMVYDAAGVRWEFRFQPSKPEYSWLDKFLANFYNPLEPVSVSWKRGENYAFSELQEAYLDALDHDDDILTQFVEEAELRKRIEESTAFSELVETWRWTETDHFKLTVPSPRPSSLN